MTRGRKRQFLEADAGFDVAAFRAWLLRVGIKNGGTPYQPSTVRLVVAGAARLGRRMHTPETWARTSQERQTVDRLLTWDDEQPGRLPTVLREAILVAIKDWPKKHRERPERSIDDIMWGKFLDACAARPRPEALVLRLMAATGLRVSDVLRIERAPVLTALANTEGLIDLTTKGGVVTVRSIVGAEAEWQALGALFQATPRARNVAELVTPGQPEAVGGPAYARMRAELYAVADVVGLAGRVHLHRLRRTVLVQALRETGDLLLVSQLGMHRSMQTTMGYVDEARVADVAKLQSTLAARFRKKK